MGFAPCNEYCTLNGHCAHTNNITLYHFCTNMNFNVGRYIFRSSITETSGGILITNCLKSVQSSGNSWTMKVGGHLVEFTSPTESADRLTGIGEGKSPIGIGKYTWCGNRPSGPGNQPSGPWHWGQEIDHRGQDINQNRETWNLETAAAA